MKELVNFAVTQFFSRLVSAIETPLEMSAARSFITVKGMRFQKFGFIFQILQSFPVRDECRNPIRNLLLRRARRSGNWRAVITSVEIERSRKAQEAVGVGVDIDTPNAIAAGNYRGEGNFISEQEISPNKFIPRTAEIPLARRQEFLENFISVV